MLPNVDKFNISPHDRCEEIWNLPYILNDKLSKCLFGFEHLIKAELPVQCFHRQSWAVASSSLQ